jgi:hypothetical protein
LPSRPEQVQQNIKLQTRLEREYQTALSIAAGRRVELPCCKTLHISLFFDGTGNNLNNDLYESGDKPHPTNIARLFRASIGAGYVGGTHHFGSKARRLTDDGDTVNNQYFKYYMPGVGTPFPEVGDLDYSSFGLALAGYGEERINWALLMIVDALRRALKLPRLDDDTLLKSVKAMGTILGITGYANRGLEWRKHAEALIIPLRNAMREQPGQSRLLGVRLYVYGFSRGAAAARAFVSWLNQMLSESDPTPCLQMLDITLPISVEYLGLLDTVASVGIANLLPGPEGHMGWAEGNQQLPDGNLVKRCLHIVASHEQRLCFPLDSIRREDGSYPANSVEVLHPGMHSDQGGGYPPGDQGKAISADPRVGDGLLLSQIALNDLYADAFAHGAPLKVPKEALSQGLHYQRWRVMEDALVRDFFVKSELVTRFNAWRQVTLGLPADSQSQPIEQAEHYEPLPASVTLEDALREQMAWITAWRIDRYAFAEQSLKEQTFYKLASDTEAPADQRRSAEDKRDARQEALSKRREVQLYDERKGIKARQPLEPGVKDYDPDMARTQLREAAEEFAEDYRTDRHIRLAKQGLLTALPIRLPAAQLNAETSAEREKMIAAGRARVSQLFPPPWPEKNHTDQHRRGNVAEWRNVNAPEGLLRALFDDQVHDSRAWFLYAFNLKQVSKGGREPGGSYLRERMVFFGNTNSRKLALYDANDQLVLAGDPRLHGLEQRLPAQPEPMTAERMAQAQKAIADRWEAYYAQASEVNDASV